MGHERAKKIVARTIQKERVPHAFLFRGPDGVGKKLFARGVAAALNCKSQNGKACGFCRSCKKMMSDNHPDYMVVSPERGAIKIDQVRKVSRELEYSPYESKLRVVVLEDVHTMRREAANSLLKTLEEPPENNLLILTAESSFEVLSTISSRCQVLPFYGLSRDETYRLFSEKFDTVSEEGQKLIARLADGSPGKAMSVFDSSVLECWITLRDLLLSGERAENLLAVLGCAGQLANLKEDLVYILDLLKLWFRDHLLAGVDSVQVDMTDWHQDGLVLSWSPEKLHRGLNLVEQAERELFFNCNAALVIEVLLFRLQEER